ncbi:hypothetical protein HanRHA438_Chr09g0401831 [Helianthus annuus]|nr:hypothetical protein HanIR_Chr09g0420841 [Helianthus annuus]KAJ0888421.1 hypothetical protein HanRHA438_Chr09g0401831 [Helianthus annuus]
MKEVKRDLVVSLEAIEGDQVMDGVVARVVWRCQECSRVVILGLFGRCNVF